jgi:hypothetical protein
LLIYTKNLFRVSIGFFRDLVQKANFLPKGRSLWYKNGGKVASEVYIYIITNPVGEKRIGKIGIIR